MNNDESLVIHMIKKGIHGFLLKTACIENIKEAVHSVVEKGFYINDSVSRMMINNLILNAKDHQEIDKVQLSPREIQVVKLISKEYKNNEIATKLFINIRTVHRHRENIKSKINARNTNGIIMYAVKNNLLD